MLTGCAPVFMLGLLGVSLGSWFFGTHIAARLTGLVLLLLFLLYFALLNWTAQSNIRIRKEKGEGAVAETDPGGQAPAETQAAGGAHSEEGEPPAETQAAGGAHTEEGEQSPFTEDDRAEWAAFLQTEGRVLWAGVIFLAATIASLTLKN